jgi:hypothetical protein
MKRLFILSLCLILASCSQTKTETTEENVSRNSLPMKDGYDQTTTTEEAAPAEASADTAYLVDPAPEETVEQKIIREARLRFETSDMDETYNQIVAAAKKYKAQIQNDSESKEYNSVSRNLTIRIPNEHFDAFLADAGKNVSYFDQKEISSTDVTEEYIDVDARLNAKKKLEARYLELLGKASKVSEMLEIERQLANVREEIEAKEGRLRYLKNRVAQSTVNIRFYKSVATQGGAKISYGTKLWNAIATGFNSILLFFVELLNNWPLILILVALIFWLWRKFKKRKKP